MAYADVHIRITSRIRFQDGHHEPGPSTQLDTTVRTRKATEAVARLVSRLLAKIHRNPFRNQLWTAVKEGFVFTDPKRSARVKLDITYTIRCWGTLHNDDGTTKHYSEEETIVRPV